MTDLKFKQKKFDSNEHSDKREFHRKSSPDFGTAILINSDRSEKIKCTLKDLSPTGAGLRAQEQLKPGEVYSVQIGFPDSGVSNVYKFEAIAAWSKPCSVQGFDCGLSFQLTKLNGFRKGLKDYIDTLKSIPYSDPRFPKNALAEYSDDAMDARRSWLQRCTNTELKAISAHSIPAAELKGNIENPIGACQIPVGIAGPLKMAGEAARGEFYIPLATTEGALVLTYHRGMRAIYNSAGVDARVVNDIIHITPAFLLDKPQDILPFCNWIKENFNLIKQVAESTTQHGRLIRIEEHVLGLRVLLKFVYQTGDAHGLNMINKATMEACNYIESEKGVKYFLRSLLSAVKRYSPRNIYCGYGKAVHAGVVLSKKDLKVLRVTPEQLFDQFWAVTYYSTDGGTYGSNAHSANAVAAMYLACGQDIADVSTSHTARVSFELMRGSGDLYASIYLPNLLVGTVGGGTNLPTQRESLELIGCFGNNRACKFAELVAGTVLAGELAVSAAIITGTYVAAHEKYGRNYPKMDSTLLAY